MQFRALRRISSPERIPALFTFYRTLFLIIYDVIQGALLNRDVLIGTGLQKIRENFYPSIILAL